MKECLIFIVVFVLLASESSAIFAPSIPNPALTIPYKKLPTKPRDQANENSLLALRFPLPSPENRITAAFWPHYKVYNGKIPLDHDFLYHVEIQNFVKGELCSGVVIDERFILTAAHCVVATPTSRVMDLTEIHLLVGGKLRGSGEHYTVKKVIIDNDYFIVQKAEEKINNDMALVMVEENIPEKYHIHLSECREALGQSAIAMGMGAVDEYYDSNGDVRHKYPERLMYDYVLVDEKIPEISTAFTVNGNLGPGDSGSPLVWYEYGNFVVGGIYNGRRLDHRTHFSRSFYLRVLDFKFWINVQMQQALNEEMP